MRTFLVVATALAQVVLGAACGGGGAAGGAAEPTSAGQPKPPPIPENCDAPLSRATGARPSGGVTMAAAVFALAECEHARLAGGKVAKAAFAGKVGEIAALYDEVGAVDEPKWVIGAHLRRGDLLRTAAHGGRRLGLGARADEWRAAARGAYEKGLGVADNTDKETRLDVDISDWVKAGCKGLRELGIEAGRFRVCKPWSESWR